MFVHPYQPDEIHFAYCYRVYARFRTKRGALISELAKVDASLLRDMMKAYDIHILECAADSTDLLVELSLNPLDAISAAISKLKGLISKSLNEQNEVKEPRLGNGYFASTIGKSTKDMVDRYLDGQSDHHGYLSRIGVDSATRSFHRDRPWVAEVIDANRLLSPQNTELATDAPAFDARMGRHQIATSVRAWQNRANPPRPERADTST